MFPFLNPAGLDPSKLDPQTLGELTQLFSKLSPEQMTRLQSLAHNLQGGFNVHQEAMEFEKTLPSDFRDGLMRIMLKVQGQSAQPQPQPQVDSEPKTIKEARLTLLKGIAAGAISPEQAYELLFPGD